MTRPDLDEVEVTIFGRGVGECIVMHIGGDWIVIDSHLDRRRPVALCYLLDLEVDLSEVKALVVTHFHSDHYWGIDRLHDACTNARLMVTEALQAEEFERLYGDDDEEPFLGMIPMTIRRARRRVLPSGSPGFRALNLNPPI
jgi:phosphoribosyl 1,2-cyclic phosphodiesterase